MLLNRLKKYSHDPCTSATYATPDTLNTPDEARVARVQVATRTEKELISNWWLIHFIDADPVQVAIWPPCNHTDALTFNPTAIAAEPIKTSIKDLPTNEN